MQKKGCNDGWQLGKKTRIVKITGVPATTDGGRTRQAFAVVNGSAPDPAQTASVAGSECETIEFTKEDVEALLNVKMTNKLRASLKVSHT